MGLTLDKNTTHKIQTYEQVLEQLCSQLKKLHHAKTEIAKTSAVKPEHNEQTSVELDAMIKKYEKRILEIESVRAALLRSASGNSMDTAQRQSISSLLADLENEERELHDQPPTSTHSINPNPR